MNVELALKINKLIHDLCTDAPHDIGLKVMHLIEAETEVNKNFGNVSVGRSFHGRDEKDALIIAEAKRIWVEEHQGKLKAVKYMMANGWGLKAAHDYCRENFG